MADVFGKRYPLATAAGTITVYRFVEAWTPPMRSDIDLLHEHLKTIKLPAAMWQRFAYPLGFERVSECRSMAGLLALWIWIADWQRTSAAVTGQEFKVRMPGSSIGRDVFEQVLTDRVKVIAPEDAPKPGEIIEQAKAAASQPPETQEKPARKIEPGGQLFETSGKSLTP